MSAPANDHADEATRHLTAQNATNLLKVGLTRTRRPVDEVIERLGGHGGADWFQSAVISVTGIPAQNWAGPIGTGPTLEELSEAKNSAKRAMAAARVGQDVAAATAGYFVAVSAALALHGAAISTHPAGELAGPVRELAGVAPEPWAGLLRRAAERLGPQSSP